VIVHDTAERDDYLRENPELDGHIMISGAKKDAFGLTRQREFVCKNLVKRDEWFMFADDNVRYFIAVTDPHYNLPEIAALSGKPPSKEVAAHWRKIFNARCDEQRLMTRIVPDMIAHCEEVGARLAGFSLTDNILFRSRKFIDVSYVIGKSMLWKNVGVPFDHTITMEDFYHTAEHLKRYGAAVTNNFVAIRAGHYMPGGMGTYDQRVPYRRHDVQELLKRYPGLFRIKDRAGFEHGTDLQLMIHSPAALNAWRSRQNRRLF
jgi:hypothetical protein